MPLQAIRWQRRTDGGIRCCHRASWVLDRVTVATQATPSEGAAVGGDDHMKDASCKSRRPSLMPHPPPAFSHKDPSSSACQVPPRRYNQMVWCRRPRAVADPVFLDPAKPPDRASWRPRTSPSTRESTASPAPCSTAPICQAAVTRLPAMVKPPPGREPLEPPDLGGGLARPAARVCCLHPAQLPRLPDELPTASPLHLAQQARKLSAPPPHSHARARSSPPPSDGR